MKFFPLNKNITPQKKAKHNNVHLIRHGIKRYLFPQNKNAKIKIASSSRFVPDKGLEVFIKAVSQMNLREKADFMIIGAGPEKNNLIELNRKLKTNIEFHEPVDELQAFLQSINIFVFPSRSENEGFPITLVEAGLSGNLVISSNFNGITNILDSEDYGFVFPIDDVDKLAELLDYSVSNFSSLEQKADAFKEKCNMLFSVDTMIDKIEKLYS